LGKYALRRILQAIPMLLLVSVVLFVLINIIPGGPLAGRGQVRHMPPEQVALLKRQFGLDQPLVMRYVYWLVGNDWTLIDTDGDGTPDTPGEGKGILRGDFGDSYRNRRPVMEVIGETLPNTLYLMTTTLLVVAIFAVPLGIISALKQYSVFDISVTTLSFMGQAVPEFWLGLILILVFYGLLKDPVTGGPLLPGGGMHTIGMGFSLLDWAKHLVLPVAMGAIGWVTWYSRFLRSSMLDVIHQDYIRTAQAKGLRPRLVVYRHALRNAMLPLVTIVALDIPYLIAGSLYVEYLFSWPGMGRLYYQAAMDRDYPVLMAILTLGTLAVVLSNLLADLVYASLDPRIHYD
jgi:peptide/nickel transport system permease protein